MALPRLDAHSKQGVYTSDKTFNQHAGAPTVPAVTCTDTTSCFIGAAIECACREMMQIVHLSLLKFWTEAGCAILHGWDQEVSAGTLHPVTLLMAFRGLPTSVAFVQPSRRPGDPQLGDASPIRLFKHHQFQVLLRVVPADPCRLWGESVEALCIPPERVAFEPEEWHSRMFDTGGRGWQVTVGGVEVTQITIIDRVGGIQLSSPMLEIAYGLERLASTVSAQDSLAAMRWSTGLSYVDLRETEEAEHQSALREEYQGADFIQHHQTLLLQSYRLGAALFARRRLFPAFEYCLKAAHLLDILDACQDVPRAELQRWGDRVRTLVALIAEQLASRPLPRDRGTARCI